MTEDGERTDVRSHKSPPAPTFQVCVTEHTEIGHLRSHKRTARRERRARRRSGAAGRDDDHGAEGVAGHVVGGAAELAVGALTDPASADDEERRGDGLGEMGEHLGRVPVDERDPVRNADIVEPGAPLLVEQPLDLVAMLERWDVLAVDDGQQTERMDDDQLGPGGPGEIDGDAQRAGSVGGAVDTDDDRTGLDRVQGSSQCCFAATIVGRPTSPADGCSGRYSSPTSAASVAPVDAANASKS